MRPQSPLSTVCALLSAALLGVPLAAQDDPKRPAKPDPEIEETVEQLEDLWPPRGRDTHAAAEVLGVLQDLHAFASRPAEKLHEKDEQRLLRTLAQVTRRGPLLKPRHAAVYEPALRGLGQLGERGVRELVRIWEDDRFPGVEDWRPTRVVLLQALGAEARERAVEVLLEVVKRGEHPRELATAGAALGNYAEADQALRKRIVEELARRLAGFENLASELVSQDQPTRSFAAQDAREILDSVSDPWLDTLQELTGAEEASGREWFQWYRDHDDEDWSRDEDGSL